MTGPECYQEAQRLAAESYHEDRFEPPAILLARAQVFATLALAAATAIAGARSGYRSRDWSAWQEVAGTAPSAEVTR